MTLTELEAIALRGTDGDDEIYAIPRGSLIDGGLGQDQLHGDMGVDTLRGGSGNDKLYGSSGNDVLSGGEDDDHLFGEEGDDFLNGELGADELAGGEGNDTYSGGGGIDFARDYSTTSNDTYRYQFGQDWLIIEDKGGIDRLEPGNLIAPSDVKISMDYVAGGGSSVTLTFKNDADQKVSWSSVFSATTGALLTGSAFESIHFANGTVWTIDDVMGRLG